MKTLIVFHFVGRLGHIAVGHMAAPVVCGCEHTNIPHSHQVSAE